MCGLMYARRLDGRATSKSLIKRYRKQAHRGTKGFGYIPIYDGKIGKMGRAKNFQDIFEQIEGETSAEILFHHRFPTSTENFAEVTHPIVVKNNNLKYDYYVIHNGIISNDTALKTKFDEMGFDYTTLIEEISIIRIAGVDVEEIVVEGHNDSESFAIDLALFLEGKRDKIEAIGDIAFICMQTNKEGKLVKLHYGRNEARPLIREANGDLFFLKSEGAGETLPEDVLYSYDYETDKTESSLVEIGKIVPTKIGFNKGTPKKETTGERPIGTIEGIKDWMGMGDTMEDGFREQEYQEDKNVRYLESGTGIPSYYSSPERLGELKDKLDIEEYELQECRDDLTMDNIDYGHKMFCIEKVRELKKSIKTTEGDIDWLEQFLFDSGYDIEKLFE